ncbi:MAG: hypothetical protein LQ337_004247 [Flavoplaca oasis]|nr:MAG: hypothetical protein LQ337_004247 [Flavoplaca oasis]
MGKPPAIVIIARHGARLDAADKEWHLSSPTPYDPPLTYGGWLQSQALGARIGSILRTTHESAERACSPSTITGEEGSFQEPVNLHTLPKPKNDNNQKRAYRVIIHSSPFLRCIQTSIAIGAGITQYEGSIWKGGQHHPLRSEAQQPVRPASPYLKGLENSTVPQLAAIPEPELDTISTGQTQQPIEQVKPCLRVDAFLGEWLSPEYFDMITPPPNSVMMVTSAKAELMKQGEYVDVPAGSHRHLPDKGNSSGLWGSASSTVPDTMNQDGSGPLSSISTIGAMLPRHNRASSHSNVNRSSLNDNNRITPRSVSKIETSTIPRSLSYDPPTPSYAISPLEPIPPGYVAHARDACTALDLQWDSMRQPHDWGNGGEYGEEWSRMHKRFRRGLESMVTWYQHNDAELTTRKIIDGTSSEPARPYQANDETDIVLILVTHGAGCNALLGALTNQPVLLDVGMASLTLAVRKESSKRQVRSSISPDQYSRRRSSIGTNVSNEYEVKITASTDHLHARGRSSTAGVLHYSPSLTSSPTSYHRYRTNSAASTASSSSFTDGDLSVEPDNRVMSSFGSVEGSSRSMSFSGGLWSKPATRNSDWNVDRLHPEKTPLPNGHSPLAKEVSSDGKLNEDETSITKRDNKVGTDHRSLGQPSAQKGLWGAFPASTVNEREKGIKRRWTHSEQR